MNPSVGGRGEEEEAHAHKLWKKTARMGLLGGIGAVLGGAGALFGGLGVGGAAKRVARTTDRFADNLVTEVREIRKLIEERALPALEGSLRRFNETLAHVDHVLVKVDRFVDVATHSLSIHTNTLGMVLMILSALLCRHLIKDIKASALESLILYTIYYTCLLLVFFFGYQLLVQLGILSSIGDYRLVIIIFSSAMFEMIFNAFWYVVEHITKLVHTLLHGLSVVADFLLIKPFVWFATPFTRGKMYFGSTCGLAFLTYIVILGVYYTEVVVELYSFAVAIWREYGSRVEMGPTWEMKFKIALILYVVCTVSALLTHTLFSCIISHTFRPYWRFRQLRQMM